MMNRFSIMLVATCMFAIGAQIQNADAQTIDFGKLDPWTAWEVMWVREQAKVGRDAYLTFYDNWDKPVFASIAESEQRHMDAILPLLEMYGLSDLVEDDTRGVFGDERHTAIYNGLLERGALSEFAAFGAAAYMEELEIDELRGAIASTDEQPLVDTYTNLLAASYNHLRVYAGHSTALGIYYTAQVLSQEDVDEILGENLPPPTNVLALNAGLTDVWYNPATAGQGFLISVYPDKHIIWLAWLTYDTELPGSDAAANLGYPGQRWLMAQGGFEGALAELQVYSFSGGLFNASEPLPVGTPMGSVMLQFEDCAHGNLTYDLPSIQRSGVIPLERVAMDNVVICEALTPQVRR